MKKGKIHFIDGRLKFGGATDPAPFPSVVVHFKYGAMKSSIGRGLSARTEDWI